MLGINLWDSASLVGRDLQRNLQQALHTLILVTVLEQTGRGTLQIWIRQSMPGAAQSNDKVFALFKMCLASFFYHSEFLNDTLHSKSCLIA